MRSRYIEKPGIEGGVAMPLSYHPPIVSRIRQIIAEDERVFFTENADRIQQLTERCLAHVSYIASDTTGLDPAGAATGTTHNS